MAGDGGLDGDGKHVAASCTCITEQGSAYAMEAVTCKALARHGQPYNPFKEKREEREGLSVSDNVQASWGEGPRPSVMTQSVAPVRGTNQAFGSVAEYGALGVGDLAP